MPSPAEPRRRRPVWRRLGALLALLAATGGAAVARDEAPCPSPGTPPGALTAASAEAPAWARARWVVTADDLKVCADGQPLLSLREQSVQALRREFPGDWPFLAVDYELRVLSLLGPFLSVEERRSTENPATYRRERVRVYDLRTPGRELTLDELFTDPALKQALLRSPLLREAAGARALARAAAGTDSRGLAERLSARPATDREGRLALPPGWLGGFWFAARRGDTLELGLALPRRSGMREETLERGRLLLPTAGARTGIPVDGLLRAAEGTVDAPTVARWGFTGRP